MENKTADDKIREYISKYEKETSWFQRKTNKYYIYAWLFKSILNGVSSLADKYYPGFMNVWFFTKAHKYIPVYKDIYPK
jgi:hypothetical protein